MNFYNKVRCRTISYDVADYPTTTHDACDHASGISYDVVRYRTTSYDIVRYNWLTSVAVSYDVVRYPTMSYENVRCPTKATYRSMFCLSSYDVVGF